MIQNLKDLWTQNKNDKKMAETHSISSTLLQRLETLLAEMEERKQECQKDGHKNIIWNNYAPTSKSSYSDKISGRCNYCGDNIKRELNEMERRELTEFYNSLNKHITI